MVKLLSQSNETRLFGERIRSERKRLGLTQEEFATLGGVRKPTQGGYEADQHVPDLDYLSRIADAGVDASYILFGRQTPAATDINFDWDMHDAILASISEWEAEQNRLLPLQKRLAALRFLYRQFSKDRAVDAVTLREALQLVA